METIKKVSAKLNTQRNKKNLVAEQKLKLLALVLKRLFKENLNESYKIAKREQLNDAQEKEMDLSRFQDSIQILNIKQDDLSMFVGGQKRSKRTLI